LHCDHSAQVSIGVLTFSLASANPGIEPTNPFASHWNAKAINPTHLRH
jgi:hypothetical protein